MTALRIFYENWRNKIVALFFAVSIWFVAYQSETRPHLTTLIVDVEPLDSSNTAVLGVYNENRQKERVAFSGYVEVEFSGPRKEIDLLEGRLRKRYRLEVPQGRDRHEFRQEDFDFPRDGVSIETIQPEWIEIHQEKLVTKVLSENDLVNSVQLDSPPAGYDVSYSEVIEPKSLKMLVPESLADKMSVKIEVPWPYQEAELEGLSKLGRRFDITIRSPDQDLVNRTVKIYDPHREAWVSPLDPIKARVRVRMSEKYETFGKQDVEVTFRLPPLAQWSRVVLHDAPQNMIPLEFSGPPERIEALEKRFEEQPGFAVSVRVPPDLDPQKGGAFTFTEDSLELPGFPDVVIRQHESRRKANKGGWFYEVKVAPELGRADGGTGP